MKEISKICPKCSGKMKYRYGQFVDYLLCETCKHKCKESEFRTGERRFEATELFDIIYYTQKIKVEKTILYFAGANTKQVNQAIKGLNQSRVYKFADAYNFNVICVGTKPSYFADQMDYSPLIKYLLSKNDINVEDITLVGFSNGGIPTMLCGSFFNFNHVCFISPVPSLYVYEFCKNVKSKVIIINNQKDYSFTNVNYALTQQLKIYDKKYELMNVDTGHMSHKSFEKLIEYIFDK
jgi:alpha/beta superfamily hydrolase